MPYLIRRNSDGSYRVENAVTGRVLAKRTSRRRAAAQVRLLHQREA